MARPKKRRKIKPRPEFLTQEEMKRLLAVIRSKRDKVIFLTAYRHGLRASEVGLLHKEDVDLKLGRITIERLKGSRPGVYPIQPDLLKLLRSYLRSRSDNSPYLFISNRGVGIDRTTLWYLMQQYGERAGLPKKKRHFHILKHSIGTHLADAGADPAFIQDWIGHENIQNTMIYTQLRNPTRDTRARKVFTSPLVI